MAEKASFAPTRDAEQRIDWNKIGLTRSRRQLMAECIGEFIGTAFVLLIGDSVSAITLLYTPSPYLTAYLGTALGWGLGVTFAILCTGSISGAHLNPAVTVSLATFRGFSWYKVPFYIVAQVIGAMVGSLGMYSQYYVVFDQAYAAAGTTRSTDVALSQPWFTQPKDYISNWLELTHQFWQTGILLLGIFAMTDPYNPGAYMHSGMRALMVGLLVTMIGVAYGFLEGWAINPARDFGPRVMAYALGWDGLAFPGVNNTWWVPIAGPLVGGLLGAGLYEFVLRPWQPGVRVHGATPTTKMMARMLLGVFPSLRVDPDVAAREDEENNAKSRRSRKSDAWDLEIGPGGNVAALGGLRGQDDYLPIFSTKHSNGRTPSMYANSNMKNPSMSALGADLDLGSNGHTDYYQPHGLMTTQNNTPTSAGLGNGYHRADLGVQSGNSNGGDQHEMDARQPDSTGMSNVKA